jgi:hypothetical protein
MALGYRPRSSNLTGAESRQSAASRIGDLSVLLWLIPFGIAAIYVVVFVAQLHHNLWVIGWYSDYSSGFTLPKTLAETGTGGNTLLGTSGAYVPLWFGILTANLPLHRELWELAPTGLFIVTALAVGWSVAQVTNRRVGAFAALLILVASPKALYFLMAPVAHNVVYPGTALLGAYLVWLTRGAGRRRAIAFAAPPLAGVALGACIASDALLIVTGMVPLAFTAVLAGVHRSRRSRLVAVSALTTTVVAIPIAKLTSTIMGSLGYSTLAPSTVTAPLSSLPRHAELMWEGLKGLFNGYLSQTAPGTAETELGVACQVIMVAALIMVLVVGAFTTAKFIWSGLRRDEQSTPTQLARALHIIYWAGSAVATCGAWALSVRIEYVHESYYATLLFSVAAIVVLPLYSRSSARWLISAGASIFFVASIVGLTSYYMESYILPIARSYQVRKYVPPISHYVSGITEFAKANHVVVGYAGYWDAPSLTWTADERILVRPVQLCRNPEGVDICPFFDERVPSWYEPKQRRTFLLVDSMETFLPVLPEGLGVPLAARAFGPVQMYVYPYDIASLMGPLSG